MAESAQHVRAHEHQSAAAGNSLPAGARVDAAHVLANAAAVPSQTVPVAVPATAAASALARDWSLELLPRLRAQGRQLARLLAERQHDLDRREAQQHAQAADLEQQMRAARLWLAERQQELSEREAAIIQRERRVTEAELRIEGAASHLDTVRRQTEQDLRRREDAAGHRQAELARQAARLDEQATALRTAQQQFAADRAAEQDSLARQRQAAQAECAALRDSVRLALAGVDRHRAAVEAEAQKVERRRAELAELARRPTADQHQIARELEEIARELEARAVRLSAAEQLQLRAETEIAALTRAVRAERDQLEQQAQIDRRRLAERERELLAEVEEERRAMHRQREAADAQRVSLERMRGEIMELHGAALEARLSAEEAQIKLAGLATPAEVARVLAETRARVADHHRLLAARVAEERASLAQLSEELAVQSRRLNAQQDDLSAWRERRQQEFDLQAAKFAEREQELRQLETTVSFERWQWNEERLAHQQELRQEAARLRDATGR